MIARLLEVQSDDVIFTSGATESNAIAILGSVRALRALAGSDAPGRNNMHVLYLPSAHASIVENVKMLETEGVTIEALPIKDYRVDTVALASMLRPETVLVSMDAVCGETGVVWNTREVALVIKNFCAGTKSDEVRPVSLIGKSEFVMTLLHVDASQAPWTEKITRDHFGADLLTLDAAKVGAVRGCGVLVAHRTIPLAPLYRGGGQERGVRPGTEASESVEKFALALHTTVLGKEKFRTSATRERDNLIQRIKNTIKGVYINEGRTQAPNILNISLPGRDTDYLVALLNEDGFAVATRSACETDSEEGSRAVFALTGDKERAFATLRISWGPSISSHELTRFAKSLASSVAFIDSNRQR